MRRCDLEAANALASFGVWVRSAVALALLPWGISGAAAAQPALIPMPCEYRDVTSVPLAHGVIIVCEGCSDNARFAAKDLKDTLAERRLKVSDSLGVRMALLRTSSLRGRRLLALNHIECDSAEISVEGYCLVPEGAGVAVLASSETGLFYGAQTVKQLIDTTASPAILHQAVIRDWPAMKVEGSLMMSLAGRSRPSSS